MQENITRRSVIVVGAMAEDHIAGGDTGMLWHLPEDLRRFKQLTIGHSVIMGRRTWETLRAPLPNRQNIVLSMRGDFVARGVTVCHSLIEGLSHVALDGPIFVIGGERPWGEALEIADEVHLTRLYKKFNGNVLFPKLDETQWGEVSRQKCEAENDGRPLRFDFIVYRRLPLL